MGDEPINRNELHDWLMKEINSRQVDAPESLTRAAARAAIDAYWQLGKRFDLFTATDEAVIKAALS